MSKFSLNLSLIFTGVLVIAFLAIFSARFYIAEEGADFKEELVQNPSRYILKVSKQVNKGVAYYLAAIKAEDERQLMKSVYILNSSLGFLSNEFYSGFSVERDELKALIGEVVGIVRHSGLGADSDGVSQVLVKASRIDRLVTRVEQKAWDQMMLSYGEERDQNQETSNNLNFQNTLLNILFFLFISAFISLFLFLRKLINMQQQLELQQASLLESEGRLKEAQQLVHLGNWELDLTSGSAIWSDEEFRLLGYEQGEVEATKITFMQAIHPEDRDAVAAEIKRSMQPGQSEPYYIEHRIVHKDGTERVVEERGNTTFDDAGIPVRMFGTTLDVTERYQVALLRRRREQGLERLDRWMLKLGTIAENYQQLYEGVCDGIMELVSADLAALPLINEADSTFTYHAASGNKGGMLLGQTLPLQGGGLCGWVASKGQGICVPDLKQDPRVIQELAENLDVTTGLLTPLTHDGRVIGGLSAFRKGEPFDEIDEELINLFGQRASVAIENMHLMTLMEERVKERTQELEIINKELESFSYSVSHDLRAPLRSIDGFSQALLEDYEASLDETGRDYLFRVRRASQRMGALIDDLLMLSRLTRRDMQCETVDLSELAEKSARQLSKDEPERSVELRVEKGVFAQADAKLMQVVFDNLLGNAWKYTAREPRAEIEFGRDSGGENRIYFIRDNGVGFDMEYADKLFGAFQRLHKSSDFEGTGIGLATVARIIHRHGGRVWADGVEGKGAAFFFTLS
ncbi:MAG: PAS domain-containing protein [Gammaproteobacteria bacterium (ex Lamellibrachia satsuma)]|nr:MAG: PAS domain-containing protein [Gammaproteobacteria bacterium (ex Lamellibrachia satsuma)]